VSRPARQASEYAGNPTARSDDTRAPAEPPNCLASSAPPEAQSDHRRAGLEDHLADLVRVAITPMLAELEHALAERIAAPPSLLTLDDVARDLAVSVRTVQRLVAAGEFPTPIRITPGRVRWRRADVDAWLDR
jgi:prophage regulatory protein